MNYFDFFIKENKSGYRTNENYLKLNNNDLYNKINDFTKINKLSNLSFKQKIWHFINNIKYKPKCYCGTELKFKKSLSEGYGKYCSIPCTNRDRNHINNVKITNTKKYGGSTPFSSSNIKLKAKKTLLDKYGVDNIFKDIQYIKDKTIKKHGISHISKLETTKNKREQTNIKSYGVKTPLLIEEVRNKSEIIKLKKFVEKYKHLKILKINGVEITIDCNKCGSPYTIDRSVLWHRNLICENPCTHCNPIKSGTSIMESEIKDFINSLGFKFIETDRTILNGKEIDIYIPELKIAIEYNGLFWHSSKFVNKNYHLNKTETCSTNGIFLIHIFEDEWLFKKDIVKSRLKNILGLTENKIYARKCQIKPVKTEEKTKFLIDNHIQAETGSKINLGLYYNDELISIMTFGNKRIILGYKDTKSNEWELLRFCNKLNTTVIGGASKLLNYFIKTYQPKEIISYADRRWSQGKLYLNLGFNFVKTSTPNYFYVINNRREHRFKFRKDVLIREGYDSNLTEEEIMLNRGINRIYDCGTILYKLCLK